MQKHEFQKGNDIIETQRDRMSKAVSVWMMNLENFPGWKEWKRRQVIQTLYFDDPFPPDGLEDFTFSDDLEKQHAESWGIFTYKELLLH